MYFFSSENYRQGSVKSEVKNHDVYEHLPIIPEVVLKAGLGTSLQKRPFLPWSDPRMMLWRSRWLSSPPSTFRATVCGPVARARKRPQMDPEHGVTDPRPDPYKRHLVNNI